MQVIRTSGLMSGDGKRGGAPASVLAPILDSTNLPLIPFSGHNPRRLKLPAGVIARNRCEAVRCPVARQRKRKRKRFSKSSSLYLSVEPKILLNLDSSERAFQVTLALEAFHENTTFALLCG